MNLGRIDSVSNAVNDDGIRRRNLKHGSYLSMYEMKGWRVRHRQAWKGFSVRAGETGSDAVRRKMGNNGRRTKNDWGMKPSQLSDVIRVSIRNRHACHDRHFALPNPGRVAVGMWCSSTGMCPLEPCGFNSCSLPNISKYYNRKEKLNEITSCKSHPCREVKVFSQSMPFPSSGNYDDDDAMIQEELRGETSKSQGNQEYEDEDRIINALILAYLAGQNGSLFALKCLVESVLVAYRGGYTYTDLKLALSLRAISAGEMGDPMMIDVLTAWVAVVLTTLKVVGVEVTDDGRRRHSLRSKENPQEKKNDDEIRSEQELISEGAPPGLEPFVRSCIDRFKSGTDIMRLQLQQGMGPANLRDDQSNGPEMAGASPSVFVLQQNTKIAILTLQMIKDLELKTLIDLDRVSNRGIDENLDDSMLQQKPPEKISGYESAETEKTSYDPREELHSNLMTGYGFGLLNRTTNNANSENDDIVDERRLIVEEGLSRDATARGLAVRLLICFNGAAMGYLRSAKFFVAIATKAYDMGFTVDDILDHLNDEDFIQSGGVMRFKLAQPLQHNQPITLPLFARWLSVVFMSLVQLGAPYNGPKNQIGWAWTSRAVATTTRWSLEESSSEDGVNKGEKPSTALEEFGVDLSNNEKDASDTQYAAQAYALSDFVHSALAAAELSDIESSDDERSFEDSREVEKAISEGIASGATQPITHYDGFSLVGIEDSKLRETSSFALMMSQLISLVRLTRAHFLPRIL